MPRISVDAVFAKTRDLTRADHGHQHLWPKVECFSNDRRLYFDGAVCKANGFPTHDEPRLSNVVLDRYALASMIEHQAMPSRLSSSRIDVPSPAGRSWPTIATSSGAVSGRFSRTRAMSWHLVDAEKAVACTARPPESAAMDTYIRITLGEVPLFGR